MIFKRLRAIQAKCDELSFSIRGKDFCQLSEAELLAHECFHLGKLIGKISNVCEAQDHGRVASREQLKQEVIPDLIIYAMRFANLYDVDVDNVFLERLAFVLDKHHATDVLSRAALLSEVKEFLAATEK